MARDARDSRTYRIIYVYIGGGTWDGTGFFSLCRDDDDEEDVTLCMRSRGNRVCTTTFFIVGPGARIMLKRGLVCVSGEIARAIRF